MASRAELLSRLIVPAYDALGITVEAEESAVARADRAGRRSAVCDAVPGWALANPHEYALIYGTPVPDYVTPAATIAPGPRLHRSPGHSPRRRCRAPDSGAGRRRRPLDDREALAAWAALFGTVSFDLSGQLHGIVGEQPGDREAFFAESVWRWAAQLGIAPWLPGLSSSPWNFSNSSRCSLWRVALSMR